MPRGRVSAFQQIQIIQKGEVRRVSQEGQGGLRLNLKAEDLAEAAGLNISAATSAEPCGGPD
jgi:hypothetical protein